MISRVIPRNVGLGVCCLPGKITLPRLRLSPQTGKLGKPSTPTPPYPITVQANIDAGQMLDITTVGSISPAPTPSEISAGATCTTNLPRQPGVAINEQVTTITAGNGADMSFTDAGDAFEYLITVTNSGNTWLSTVSASDPMFEVDELACGKDYGSSDARFAPGDSVECTASLTLEQVHIDSRCVDNSAEVSESTYEEREYESTNRQARKYLLIATFSMPDMNTMGLSDSPRTFG